MASLCHSLFGAELILVKLGLLQTYLLKSVFLDEKIISETYKIEF